MFKDSKSHTNRNIREKRQEVVNRMFFQWFAVSKRNSELYRKNTVWGAG